MTSEIPAALIPAAQVPVTQVPVTQARDDLAELINRVAYGHERIVLTRHNKPVACLVPPADLARLEQATSEGPERISLVSSGPEPGPRAVPGPSPLPAVAVHRLDGTVR
jgi:prevent-host-death family protein